MSVIAKSDNGGNKKWEKVSKTPKSDIRSNSVIVVCIEPLNKS